MILFCHGNAGNITHRIDILRALHDRVGAAVLMFDYRGYGRSEGKPDEPGVLADARAARAWLAEKAGVPQSRSCSWASRWAAPWRSIWPPTAPGH